VPASGLDVGAAVNPDAAGHLNVSRFGGRLTGAGLELIEIAPGIDLHRDVLDRMDFAPLVAADLRHTDDRLFHPEPFGLHEALAPGA